VANPLDDYVFGADENYGWVDSGVTITGRGRDGVSYVGYMLNMTSQKWLTEEDSSRSLWWHQMVVIVPSNLDPKYKHNSTMWITGGGNDCDHNECNSWPTPTDEDIWVCAALAMGTGTITTALFQIPNEHITFQSDAIQKSRTEDAIIAFTWDHFLNDPTDPTWLVRFPMVKASVRAMDAVSEWLAAPATVAKVPEVDGYTGSYVSVAGASKRGWTTWLVGAVDPARVVAIIPIVLDALNFINFGHKQYKSLDGWSFALSDYYEMNITARFDDPNMVTLSEMEDPYFYFDRLTMPKLVVNAVGDEFQQPDDTRFWWKDLPQPKHFLMVPNAEHSLATGIFEAVPAIGTWIKYLLDDRAVPTMDWTIDNQNGDNSTGAITVNLHTAPVDASTLHVRKYWATSWAGSVNAAGVPRRDFRFLNLDDPCSSPLAQDGTCFNTKVFWQFEDLTAVEGSNGLQYVAEHAAPTDGSFAAFLIDVTYDKDPATGGDLPYGRSRDWFPDFIPRDGAGQLEFTTEVSIVPNHFPYADCKDAACYGVLV
jgi:PhoPQ-activated pathogenicity-related protein